MEMKDLYKKYVKETFDENGLIKDLDFHIPENFNFAYDIIDVIGKNEPERKAMVWVNDKGEEHTFTYKDLSVRSNQCANMLLAHGVKKVIWFFRFSKDTISSGYCFLRLIR